ncbi:unnamed protein product [Spirodela intermedia]|uniref:Protein EARLY HEADING DATE 2 n=1 Tax=Spirodela intermedia TaxID=51605 RepID=A0A7I8JDG5_SPIIN|nr:unnamed protein product [Spirodela intermedia]CAA6667432.1 unnamed protein product [Spirodela intermedia]
MASNSASDETSVSAGDQRVDPLPTTAKKRRNLPGMPDPNAEVIALSPKTLMATNRFVCEICNKGFQRDQNLQLHLRGHNLPWKLRQRSGKEVRKRVYVCPEPSCVHHDPSRALGDLTGIKKHFCRKHGEKKFECEKCSKKYAVQSDWKAHAKTCGTREYRCDCGTLFSRKDSFMTHRAFCEALAEENAKALTTATEDAVAASTVVGDEEGGTAAVASSSSSPSSAVVNPAPPPQMPTAAERPKQEVEEPEPEPEPAATVLHQAPPPPAQHQVGDNSGSNTAAAGGSAATSIFASLFSSAAASVSRSPTLPDFTPLEPISLSLSRGTSTFFSSSLDRRPFAASPPSPHLSATALLQKAAQMGPTASGASLLRSFGLHEQDSPAAAAGAGSAALPNLLMPPPSFFATKPATLDLLGLGGGPPAVASLL